MRSATFLALAALLMTTSNAHAVLKVTNLSNAPQTVTLDGGGSLLRKVIAPHASAHFSGSDGLLSLESAKNPSAGDAIGASGMLSGMIGAVRTSQIPASQMDQFVIWPNGEMLLQMRQKKGMGH
jgi:hypothetical protein